MEIPVDGKENNKKWVIIDGNGTYRTGTFTGTKVIPEIGNTKVDYGNLYATQTF